ncbi:MAG: transposase [Candidatus Electrothrix sp. GM3_4]|nr:transposase [Candidatus Electrothrix sp. GM3_4]
MIDTSFKEAFSAQWIKSNIIDSTQDLVVIRDIIPWGKIIMRLSSFYTKDKGAVGKSLRIMIAILIVMKHYKLSDRDVIQQIKENRYMQYFCNVPDENLMTFLHPSSLCVLRKRLGEEGISAIEKHTFETFRSSGVINGDNALIDSTVLNNNIIYPTDVQLIYKAFSKMRQFAEKHDIQIWWNDDELKKKWRSFNLTKQNRAEYLCGFNELFFPALKIFNKKVEFLECSKKLEINASALLDLLNLLEEQTLEKLEGEQYIKNRIVSLDEPDARPIKKGKSHPKCEFGTTLQMTFNREGFLITVENFIGKPNDKNLFPETFELFTKRMRQRPRTVVCDLGFRSRANFKVAGKSDNVFLGRSGDVFETKKAFCQKARSGTEGFIAVAKNLRGFRRSLYRGLTGDRIWSLLCQTSYNIKKFLQLWREEKISENSLVKLGLA